MKAAVTSIKPTSPPTETANALRTIAEQHQLSNDQTVELIERFFAHFDIDPAGAPVMVVLRSGYQIPAEGNIKNVVEHLCNAIVGESTARFGQDASGDWSRLWEAITDEVQHVAYETHGESVRAILAYLLLEAAHTHWGKLVNELFPFLEVDSLPPSDIPGFLKIAKKKLVLLLGADSGSSLKHLQQVKSLIESHGYQCQLIKELPEHTEMGLIGKVLFAALSARFVIIENTTASGHLYELPFVRMAECVVAMIQEEGKGASWMIEDMIPKHDLIEQFKYSADTLGIAVKDAIVWAEGRVAANVKANKGAWAWASDEPEAL